MLLLLFKTGSKTNKLSSAAPIPASTASQTTLAVVCTKMAALVADAATVTVTVAAAPTTAVVADLVAVVMEADSVLAAAQTHYRITSTGIITTQLEGLILRKTCPSPACVTILNCN